MEKERYHRQVPRYLIHPAWLFIMRQLKLPAEAPVSFINYETHIISADYLALTTKQSFIFNLELRFFPMPTNATHLKVLQPLLSTWDSFIQGRKKGSLALFPVFGHIARAVQVLPPPGAAGWQHGCLSCSCTIR